jgi:diguanylate cyclase (GGDEF)-like protein
LKYKVLLIEHDASTSRVLKRVIGKANFDVVTASSLAEAKHIFDISTPETYLCAVVDYHLPDAPFGEAIDHFIDVFIPVVVITNRTDEDIRKHILSKAVVDYIPKQNTQIFEYLSRLLERLEKNNQVGVLVVDASRKNRNGIAPLLKRHNFSVYETNTADNVNDLLFENGNIKLVVVDEEMPEREGTQIVADIRRSFNKSEMSIIGVSNGRKPALLARFLKSGANDYLTRPYCHEEFFCRIMQNIEHIEQIDVIRKTANTDYLTGLPNRRHFFNQVEAKLKRGLNQMCLALLDLDHFKKVNDNYGHDYGDMVLKETSKLLNKHFSNYHISRFGGEEFCLFLPNTDIEQALLMLNDFREALAIKAFKRKGQVLSCTVSIGVTDKYKRNLESMLGQADRHLYKAKSNGRNCVVAAI